MTNDPIPLQRAVHAWQAQRFPHIDLPLRGLKIGEEAGEVQKTLVRRIEDRPGGEIVRIVAECCDLQIVLLGLAEELGFDLLTETVHHLQGLIGHG